MPPNILPLELYKDILSVAKILQLRDFLYCFMCIRYGVSVRSLCRYSNYSVRTWFRFMSEDYLWERIRMKLFLKWVYQPEENYIIAIDEVVEGKVGTRPMVCRSFGAAFRNAPYSGFVFLCFSDSCGETEIISDGGRASRTDRGGQEADSGTEKKALAGKQRSAEGRCLVRGRKQGSKNRPKQPNPTASFRAFTALLNKLLSCLPGHQPDLYGSRLCLCLGQIISLR
ncbi:MAG: hypothetical protein IPM47_10915 [Sphingobacteriales bacterium]|nr:MAG: hypothetical protein IPM47_10915 [Sphingobacteriales bacterium]